MGMFDVPDRARALIYVNILNGGSSLDYDLDVIKKY
jgi:hypothetical protein